MFWKVTSPIALIAATFAIYQAPAAAEIRSVLVKPRVTGIGFDDVRMRARRRAIAAWRRVSRLNFGKRYSHFLKARSRQLTCAFIGWKRLKRSGALVGVSGNPNARWSCTAHGRPTLFRPPPGRPKTVASGIGFGASDAAARGLAIRAWTNAVRRHYGQAYANYNKAKSKSLHCARLTSAFSRHRRRAVIGVEGNPNSPWTCTAMAIPRA